MAAIARQKPSIGASDRCSGLALAQVTKASRASAKVGDRIGAGELLIFFALTSSR